MEITFISTVVLFLLVVGIPVGLAVLEIFLARLESRWPGAGAARHYVSVVADFMPDLCPADRGRDQPGAGRCREHTLWAFC